MEKSTLTYISIVTDEGELTTGLHIISFSVVNKNKPKVKNMFQHFLISITSLNITMKYVGPRGSAVECQSLASIISPSCTRPVVDR